MQTSTNNVATLESTPEDNPDEQYHLPPCRDGAEPLVDRTKTKSLTPAHDPQSKATEIRRDRIHGLQKASKHRSLTLRTCLLINNSHMMPTHGAPTLPLMTGKQVPAYIQQPQLYRLTQQIVHGALGHHRSHTACSSSPTTGERFEKGRAVKLPVNSQH